MVQGIDDRVGELVVPDRRFLEIVRRVQEAAHASFARVLADARSAGRGRIQGDMDAASRGEKSHAVREGGDSRVTAVVRNVVRTRLADAAGGHCVDDVA